MTTIKLIDTKAQRPTSGYIALSHCWGPGKLIKTTSKTISNHSSEIVYTDLARTFQDAVTTAQEMDISYLWVDNLCIIQDQRDDWGRHAEQMDKIY